MYGVAYGIVCVVARPPCDCSVPCRVRQSGDVRVDGVSVRDANLKSLRSCIGVVSQEPRLFAMSLHDNIAAGACVS